MQFDERILPEGPRRNPSLQASMPLYGRPGGQERQVYAAGPSRGACTCDAHTTELSYQCRRSAHICTDCVFVTPSQAVYGTPPIAGNVVGTYLLRRPVDLRPALGALLPRLLAGRDTACCRLRRRGRASRRPRRRSRLGGAPCRGSIALCLPGMQVCPQVANRLCNRSHCCCGLRACAVCNRMMCLHWPLYM